MRMADNVQERAFYVVQFAEVIDSYVCVPYSWIIFDKFSKRNIFVIYPKYEDHFETRERVKRKERPNKLWSHYRAYLKYASDDFQDADFWIARNEYRPDEEELNKKNTNPKLELNRKLRSANQSCWSQTNSDKPQIKVKPMKNKRRPVPRMSMRRSPSPEPDQNLNKKCSKSNENPKPVVVTDHITAASSGSRQEQSIIITGNQVIQKDQTKMSYTSNGKMNTEQSTGPVIKENHSAYYSVQYTLAKLPVEHQLSPQPPMEQQLSLQPPSGREPSPQPPIDRQPSPKLVAEQNSSLKFSGEQEPSPVGQDYQQPVSMSTVDLDEPEGDLNSCQNVLPEPVTDERPCTKTPPSTFETSSQPDPINETSTPLLSHKDSLPEPHSRGITAGQSKEPSDCQKTQIFTPPKIVPRSLSTTNQLFQQYGHPQLPNFSVNSALNLEFQPHGFGVRNSIEVADNQSLLRSQNIIDSMPSTSHQINNIKVKATQQSSAVKKLESRVDKKTRLEGITKNIATLQYPPNLMRQLDLPASSTIAQPAQFAQHHLQQAQIGGSLMNDVRYGMRENFISPRDPRPQGKMNTPATQNLSELAHQYNSFWEDYLQQFPHLQDMFKRQTMTPTLLTLEQKAYHQNAMINEGFVIRNQPSPINQPTQFFPQNGNQYVPINSAYSQEVKSHELMKKYADGSHVIYKPVADKEVNIQLLTHDSSSQSHQNDRSSQKEQEQLNYRDPPTTSTQNSPLMLKRSYPNPEPQRITKRSRSLFPINTPSQALLDPQKSGFIQELGIQERVNQSSTKSNNTNLAAISEIQTVELAPSTADAEVQTMPSSHQMQATQFTLVQNEHDCQGPEMKNNMVDKATTTNSMTDIRYCVELIAGSGESPSREVEHVWQTDEWLEKEQNSFYQETSLDSENATDNDIESENEVVLEANQATLTAEQNLTQENQHRQSTIMAQRDVLDEMGTLWTQLGATLAFIHDIQNYLQNFNLICAQRHETLSKKFNKLTSIESPQISASPPNNVISQATQGRLAGDNGNTPSVSNATTSIRDQRGGFTLPPEYDPNDTKWTLKYREKKPGLVELIPQTEVYVKRKELKRCMDESNDCITLVRLLLTEVFSNNALSVCSWTGGKAKAFSSANNDVRPRLDKNAITVLLTFVEKYRQQRGWSAANISVIISTIRNKMNDLREKYERTCKVNRYNNNNL